MNNMLLRTKNITKHFGGIQALKGIDLEIFEGEICALVGENGAGKSTLAKIIAGVHAYDSGSLEFQAAPVVFHNTNEAVQAGIAIVLQEFNLIPHHRGEYLFNPSRSLSERILAEPPGHSPIYA